MKVVVVARQDSKRDHIRRLGTVDDFVAAEARSFVKVQQTSTSRPQTVQHQSLRINKIP